MKKIDIVIPVGGKDVGFVSRVIDYILRCVIDVNHIYIFTKKDHIKKLNKRVLHYPRCVVLDENAVIPELSFARIKNILIQLDPGMEELAGWYFQQFLKLGFSKSSYCSEYYVTWDADTLPLAPITFFENGHLLYNPKCEYNANYFKTIERLFGFGKVAKHSFISESMIFSGEIVRQMLADIEKTTVEGNDWMEKILSACDFTHTVQAFSEFETYGSYCHVNFPTLYIPRPLNTFREAGMIRGRNISETKLRKMSFDLDMASFEIQDMPPFPYNLPNLIWKNKLRFKKLYRMKLGDLILTLKNKKKLRSQEKNILSRLPPK